MNFHYHNRRVNSRQSENVTAQLSFVIGVTYRSNHGLHRSSIYSDRDDIMLVRTPVASDVKQRRERVREGGDGTDEKT